MATRTFERRPALSDPQKRITDLVARHEPLLLRVARRWSLCADDAQDAYQRALEIYIRRLESLDPATELAWLKVVIRHEAFAIRRARQESVTGEEVDFDARAPVGQRSTEDRFESSERVARSAEIIRRLKPDEAKALMLKAEGLSYEEIGSRLGWSYTNVTSIVALFIALGGTSYAALTLPRNSVGSNQIRSRAVGASELRTQAVSGRSVRDRSLTLKDMSSATRLTLKGDQGAQGSQGDRGPAGPSGVTYRASVNSGGGTPSGNAIGAGHQGGTNEYTVLFDRQLDACVSTATLASVFNGPNLEVPPPGRITVAQSTNIVTVRTFAADGSPDELPFNIIVAC